MRRLLFGLSLCFSVAAAACGHERPNIAQVPKHEPGTNPFEGRKLYVDPGMSAVKQAATWRGQRPADAALID